MADEYARGIERRGVLATLALGGLAATVPATAAARPTGSESLLTAFRQGWATVPGSTVLPIERRLSFLVEAAIVIDDDTPFPLGKPAYADHLAFHAANWERVEWLINDLVATVHGDTGIVASNYFERGKPKDAGFRLRAGYCTAVCVRGIDGWRAISVHMSPQIGQILDASPS